MTEEPLPRESLSTPIDDSSRAPERDLEFQVELPPLPESYPLGIQVPPPNEVTAEWLDLEGEDEELPVRMLPAYAPNLNGKHPDILFLLPQVRNNWAWPQEGNLRPRLLLGFDGNTFERAVKRAGVKSDRWAATALVRYPTSKVKATDIAYCERALISDINYYKPKVIVCLGKKGFDFLIKERYNQKEVQGGFFFSERFQVNVYCTESIFSITKKPESLPKFQVDMKHVIRWADSLHGLSRERVKLDYRLVDTIEKVREMVGVWKKNNSTLLSTDCEWGRDPDHPEFPVTYVDAKLRSIQFCDKPGRAWFIKFRDETETYTMNASLLEVGEVLGEWCNRPEVKYIGHNIAADMVWMYYHLRLAVAGKVHWDTMFAEITIDEAFDQKLERLAIKYTDLGRYDIELMKFRKKDAEVRKNSSEDLGYAMIPDKIIFPYGCSDVDTPMRAWKQQKKALERDGTYDYYINTRLPFVTDGFLHLSVTGLPILKHEMAQLREDLNTTYRELFIEFKKERYQEAKQLFVEKVMTHTASEKFLETNEGMQTIFRNEEHPVVWLKAVWYTEFSKEGTSMTDYYRLEKYAKHLANCTIYDEEELQNDPKLKQGFNLRSQPQMRLWLYDINGHVPIKTTKVDGIQMAWEKAMEFPEDKRKDFQPATDASSLKVFARNDTRVEELLAINAVGNILKAFLAQPDEETGLERGMLKWICSDGKIHSNFVLTESGRPRSFNPNVLNIPKYVANTIEKAVMKVLGHKVFSLRSCIGFPYLGKEHEEEQYCVVDTDLMTAEIVALGVISGDEGMVKACTNPDTQFAFLTPEGDGKPQVVRLNYDDSISPIPEHNKDPELLHDPNDPRLMRDENGNLKHPRRDNHWELAEMGLLVPREKLDKATMRDGLAKPTNFSAAYGATPGLIERRYEEETGKKPEEGMGEALLEAWDKKNFIGGQYLKELENCPSNPGYMWGIAGHKRHFAVFEDYSGLSPKAEESLLSGVKPRGPRNL
jgi:hypothetical protein